MKRPCARAHRAARDTLKQRVHALRSHVRAAAAHDVEGIHDLRVASRRLRAALGDHAKMFRKRALKPFRKRIRAITRGLGVARELDVTLALLRKRRRAAPKKLHPAIARAARILRDLRAAESDHVDASCALARGAAFRDAYRGVLHGVKHTKKCYRKHARTTLHKRHDALVAAHRAWNASPSDEGLHRVRVAFKKLRYSCEIAKDIYGGPMDEFIERVKLAQELLGDWNDLRVLRDYLARAAELAPAMADAFETLERNCDTDASNLIKKYAKAAPGLFDDAAQAEALRLFKSPNVPCCPRRADTKTIAREGKAKQ